jgi:hypothetical protein
VIIKWFFVYPMLLNWSTKMRKLAIRALAAAVLISSAAPAFAGYWYNGVYYCTYGWYYNAAGQVWYGCE